MNGRFLAQVSTIWQAIVVTVRLRRVCLLAKTVIVRGKFASTQCPDHNTGYMNGLDWI